MTECSPRRIVHLDMDAFFVEVERLRDPSLRGRPVIVGGDPNARGVVAAASYEARRFGVHSAMPLRTAKRLCPQAVFVHARHDRYGEASDRVFEILEAFAPVVEPVSIDEAYLDLTGTDRLYGSSAATVRRLRAAIREKTGLPSSAGIGTSKLVTKVTSGLAKPDGQIEVPAGGEAAFLAKLDVNVIPGVGKVGEGKLRAGGIATIGDLTRLGRGRLEAWLGDTGVWLWECSQGIDDRPVELPGEPKSIGRETTLARDSSDAELLESTLHHLAERAAARLRRHHLRARTVTVKFRTSNFQTFTRARSLPAPTDLDTKLIPVALDLFRKIFHDEHGGHAKVRLIGASFSGLSHDPAQIDLLDGEREKRLERLVRGVDAVRERYGSGAIVMGKAMRYLEEE